MHQNNEKRKLEQILECPICLQRFISPIMLPCRHTYCKECILPLIINNTVRCPLDTKIHIVQPGGFPSDFLMNSLLDIKIEELAPGNIYYIIGMA